MAVTVNANREIGMGLAMLMEAFRVEEQGLTDAQIRLLQHALSKIPAALIEPAIMHTIDTRTSKAKNWLPSNAELLADAETVRQQFLAAHPWEPCVNCEDSPRWQVTTVDGVKRLSRCPCWIHHQAKLASLGVTNQPLALPPADLARAGDIE